MAKARLIFIAATLGLLAILALAACGGDSGSSGGSGSSNAGKSNAELVKAALSNSKTIKSYHTDMSIDQAGQAITLTGDVDVTNKNYKLSANAAGFKIGQIKVGSDNYVSMDGGTTWTKSDPSQAGSFDSLLDMFKDAKPDEVDKVKDKLKDGTPATEKIDGVDTKHITADAKDLSSIGANTVSANAQGTPQPAEGTMDMWVSTNDKPVFYRIKMDGTSAGQPIKADITWSKIDQPVDIKAPNTTP